MNFSQFVQILLARYKMIIAIAVITLLTACLVSLLFPKSYKAATTIILNYKGVDPVTGLSMPAQLMPGYMATQVDIIQSKNVTLDVIKRLQLTEVKALQEQFASATKGKQADINEWLADLLEQKLDVIPSKESSVISIGYKGVDPVFAATMANAYAESYINLSLKLKIDPAIKASQYLSEQTKVLHDNLKAAQDRLSDYQQKHGITSIQDAYDVETSKLRDLSSQYSLAQSQSIDANSRRNDASKNMSESPDVVQNPVVQNLRMSLATAESKLAEMGQRYSKNHPSYISAEAEVAKLRSQLNAEVDRAVVSLSNSASINSQRLGDLKFQLEKQKQKVLELNRSRSDLSVLEKEVQIAEVALESVNNRFSQTALEGQSTQGDISILEPAVPPLNPSNPSILLIAPFSLIIGSLLGCLFAILAELMDRRIRSKDDLLGLNIPVYEYHIKTIPIAN
ncbi:MULTISPECIES: chain length determinant protein EpsF [unclassified Methylophilus]|jgi:polysaccharide biosynthesis transport protein|uniref:chain length determinant protein EpsF n=1 Tax=unclassified Methylophilus TaxID=2630143 RepID=UPI0023B348D6|nr:MULTISPECIES: chain length determinant protein EpsF [unclassified Methylophilus]MDF0376795.1 chain length determinant protein EpsF [Methylophilus sp. YYY-1]MDT7850694.1 chain length determinant protein EpsF [Methylophilus sp. VKM B-3414]